MKFSTKGRYALRLMIELAGHDPQENVPLKNIAEKQEISLKYLEQIITLLSRAGLVRADRGSQGGYHLTRRPEQYTAGDILRVVEGNLAPIPCLQDEENLCPMSGNCLTLPFWEGLDGVIRTYVDSVTLADLYRQAESFGPAASKAM